MNISRDGFAARDLLFIVGALLAGSVVSMAGFHLLERGMAHRPAFLLSHGAGLVVLIVLLGRWWSRRTPER